MSQIKFYFSTIILLLFVHGSFGQTDSLGQYELKTNQTYTGLLPVKFPPEKIGDIEAYWRTFVFSPDSTFILRDFYFTKTEIVCDACNVVSLQYSGTWSISGDTIRIKLNESEHNRYPGYPFPEILILTSSGNLTDPNMTTFFKQE